MSLMVEFKNVTKRYGELTVLDELNLAVETDEKVAIIGPSGSGKTTVLRMLMTLERIDSGVIYVDGVPLTHMERKGDLVVADEKYLRQVRGRIGMVFQHFNLFPLKTAMGNCIEAPMYVLGLSGGQQQRVAIARALAMRPKVMLFDEVTSALDPELVGEVLQVIRQLGEDHSLTMLIVTHQMGFAREFADRVCFFYDGQILEQGPPAQLFGNPEHERTRQFLSAVLEAH